MKKIIINAEDNYPLSVNVYECSNPIGIVQIIHGMEEHQGRYEEFAIFLQNNGFIVVTSDLRGHGPCAETLGYFKDKDGYKLLVSDEIKIREWIAVNYQNIPIYLLAHSMGTLIARNMLQKYSVMYNKVVLIGYPNYDKNAYIGIFLSNIIKAFHGPKYKSKLLEKLSVGRFNKKFKNAKTPVDWLCSDYHILEKYHQDKYCGFIFTCSAFNDLYHLVINIKKSNSVINVNKDLKFLLLNGEDDPCVGGGKGIQHSIMLLNKMGFVDISKISYPQMRHEILNENNKELVYNDILNFLK